MRQGTACCLWPGPCCHASSADAKIGFPDPALPPGSGVFVPSLGKPWAGRTFGRCLGLPRTGPLPRTHTWPSRARNLSVAFGSGLYLFKKSHQNRHAVKRPRGGRRAVWGPPPSERAGGSGLWMSQRTPTRPGPVRGGQKTRPVLRDSTQARANPAPDAGVLPVPYPGGIDDLTQIKEGGTATMAHQVCQTICQT